MKNLKLTSKESTEANFIEDTKAIDIQTLSFSYFQYNMVDYNTFTIATVKGLLRKSNIYVFPSVDWRLRIFLESLLSSGAE